MPGRERELTDAVLQSLPGVLYVYDEVGKFERWNENFERVTGYSSDEVASMHPLEFFPAEEQGQVAARIAEVFRDGESDVEAHLLAKNGERTPYHFTGVRALIDGRVCLVGVGIDVAERHRAEAARTVSEGRYRTLFEYAPDGLVIADRDSRYLDANESICRMLGYPRSELVGLHASDIVVPAEVAAIAPALKAIESRADYHREWQFRRKDGTSFPAEVMATTMPDGNLLGMIRDVTERKRTERELRDLNATLELRVASRTAELARALERAEAADRTKSAFLASMSHELRTPLNSVLGFSGILLQGLAGPLNAEQAKQLGMVRSSARHLLNLINDVLDISKIEAQQLDVQVGTFDVRGSIAQVLAAAELLAAKKGVTLTDVVSPELGEMVSDRRRFEQILINLVNNAVKFTERGSVTMTADVVAHRSAPEAAEQPAIRVRITDTGIGIRAEDVDSLFQPFKQIDTGLGRQHEGTGLGLAISRRLATLLGGEIQIRSEWQRGSEFTVILPLDRRGLR